MAYNKTLDAATKDTQDQIAALRKQVNSLLGDRVQPMVDDYTSRAQNVAQQATDYTRDQAETVPNRCVAGPWRRSRWPARWATSSAALSARPMQTIDLARTAAAAEILRIRRLIARQVNRAIYAAGAVVFALGALILLHCVIYEALLNTVSPLVDTVLLLVLDVVVAGVFGVIALRGAPDRLETEARELRDRSIAGMKTSLALETLTGPVGRIAWRQFRRSRRK